MTQDWPSRARYSVHRQHRRRRKAAELNSVSLPPVGADRGCLYFWRRLKDQIHLTGDKLEGRLEYLRHDLQCVSHSRTF
jgi:hypothetical protein